MKIGILTFHDGINYGAFLQVFAMQNILRDMGHDVEVINYKSWRHWKFDYTAALYTHRPVRFAKNIGRLLKFKKSQQLLRTTEPMRSTGDISRHHYDAVILGSDEIWNFANPASGYDLTYFGVGFEAGRKIAYAASFGSISSEDPLPEEVRAALSRLDAVSVRDRNSYLIAKKARIVDVPIVLDPTLLYDFSGLEKPCKYKDYLLVYTTERNAALEGAVRAYAQKRGLLVIGIGHYAPWCDHNIMVLDPFEWIGYFKQAKAIVTTMFHGTMFAIKYGKPFCTIVTPYRRNKLKAVGGAIGANGRMTSDTNEVPDIIDGSAEMDYTKLYCECERSFEYIKYSIDVGATFNKID